MATYKSEYAKIIIIESPFVFMNAYQCQRTLLQTRTNTSSLNVLPSAAEYSTKLLQVFHVCNEIPLGMLAKVI